MVLDDSIMSDDAIFITSHPLMLLEPTVFADYDDTLVNDTCVFLFLLLFLFSFLGPLWQICFLIRVWRVQQGEGEGLAALGWYLYDQLHSVLILALLDGLVSRMNSPRSFPLLNSKPLPFWTTIWSDSTTIWSLRSLPSWTATTTRRRERKSRRWLVDLYELSSHWLVL